MTVDPVNRGQVPSPGPNRADKSQAGGNAKPDTVAKADVAELAPDRVELSSAAKELRQLAAVDRPESNTLSPERMKQVLQRITDGFYEQPEIIDQVTRRVVDDL